MNLPNIYLPPMVSARSLLVSVVLVGVGFLNVFAETPTNNLLRNSDFSVKGDGGMPQGWETVAPNPALAPRFAWSELDGMPVLLGQGNGRNECLGYVRQTVHLSGGKSYQFRVRFRCEGIEDIDRNVVHMVVGGWNDGLFDYHQEKDWIVGENRFPGPDQDTDVEVRLYFRHSAQGKVWWRDVVLVETDPIPERPVTIACSWGTWSMDEWALWLDAAGKLQVDIALLPEMFNGKSVAQAEPLDGPAFTLLSEKAKQWKMYVSGSAYIKRGDVTFNTAPLFNREGGLVGMYDKNQLYDPEQDEGATSGVGFPVFDTDVGKVGMMICYDSWFPETARILARRGAEIVLFPNAGYFAGLMPARAADNGIWIVVSSLNGPAGVWDSGGAEAGEAEPNPTRFSPPTIKDFKKIDDQRMIVVTFDASRRVSPHWWGGPMRSAPGVRRARQTGIESLESELVRESHSTWTE